MRNKLLALVSLLMVASMLLGACAQQPPPTPQTIVQTVEVVKTIEVQKEGQTVIITATPEPTKPPAPTQPPAPAAPKPAGPKSVKLAIFTAGDIPTLDPAVAEDTSAIEVLSQTNIGLTHLDEEKISVEPGIADKWDISQDGTTYTFHLRKDVPWVKYDGAQKKVVKVQSCAGADRMVTAQDFEYGFKRTIAPKTASPYAYVLDFAIAGAQEYTDGKAKDASKVGVTAVDTYTLELKFNSPAAYNANIAGMWVGYAQPRWLIDGDDCTQARGERWTETGFNQSYGPFVLREWIHDSSATIVKNPFWPGISSAPQPKLDEVIYQLTDETASFADYEAGAVDVSTLPLADIDRVKTDPTLSKELKIAPSLATYYYGFNTQAPIVSDVRVRQALSLAVDRQSLIDNVTKANQEPAHWFCRPGLVGCPTLKDYPDLGVKFDKAKAMATLDGYLKEKNTTADKLDLTLMFNTSSGHQKIAEAVQQMWKDNLGVNVKLVNQEWKVYLVTTKSKNTPQIFRMGWNLDYPDANNFDKEVASAGGSQNPVDKSGKPSGGFMWKDDKYEQLVADAAKELDPQKRIKMYADAEQILVWDDAVMIPLYWYTSASVTKPYVSRTWSNTGSQNMSKWDVNPH